MRIKVLLSTAFLLAVTPALAHPEHGFQLPDLLHVVTQADHLAIAAGAVVFAAVVGRLALKHLRK